MRSHYDFDKMNGEKNPYIKRLKQPITIRLDKTTVSYVKSLAGEIGMPYQNLINLYLRDCAMNRKKLKLRWGASDRYGTRRPRCDSMAPAFGA